MTPLLFHFAAKLFPVPFDLIPVHSFLLYCSAMNVSHETNRKVRKVYANDRHQARRGIQARRRSVRVTCTRN